MISIIVYIVTEKGGYLPLMADSLYNDHRYLPLVVDFILEYGGLIYQLLSLVHLFSTNTSRFISEWYIR